LNILCPKNTEISRIPTFNGDFDSRRNPAKVCAAHENMFMEKLCCQKLIQTNVKKPLSFYSYMVAKTGLMLTHCGSKPGSRLENHLKFMEILSGTATTI